MPNHDLATLDPSETLVFQGGAIKALDESGKIGGHLVLFGSSTETDATRSRDYFTPETDYGLDAATKSRVYYQHTLDKTLKNKNFGVGEMKSDEAGIWIESQLNLRDAYEKRIFGAIKSGKMGWSAGTAEHLVRKEKQSNGSHKITVWPLGLDASITPTPAEPRTAAVALKSLTIEPFKLMAEGDDESGGSTSDSDTATEAKCMMKTGDAVKWAGYGSMKKGHGKIVSLHDAGNCPGCENHVEATKELPVAKVHVRERLPEGGYRDTGRHQAHPINKLKPDTGDAVKGLYLGDTDEAISCAAISRLNDLFMSCFWRLVGSNGFGSGYGSPAFQTDPQRIEKIAAAFDEYKVAAMDVIEHLLGESSDATTESVKALVTKSSEKLQSGLTLNDHSDSVLIAVKGLSARLDWLARARSGQGRDVLSRDRVEGLKTLVDDLGGLLTRATEAAKGSPPSQTEILRLQAGLMLIEAREAGYV